MYQNFNMMMNIEGQLEQFIKDTTGGADDELELESYACACGTEFSNRDEGVSTTLKRCAACYESIRNELCNDDNNAAENISSSASSADVIEPTNVANDDDANGSFVGVTTAESNMEGANDDHSNNNGVQNCDDDGSADDNLISIAVDGANLSLNDIEDAMAAAVSDAIKCFSVSLNQRMELFHYHSDPINLSGTRKLFQRASWTYKPMYWYEMFGGMMTQRGKTLITPCAVRSKKGGVYILMGIGETLCHRPRYDGLVIDIDTKKTDFVHNIGSFVDTTLLDYRFDGDLMDR